MSEKKEKERASIYLLSSSNECRRGRGRGEKKNQLTQPSDRRRGSMYHMLQPARQLEKAYSTCPQPPMIATISNPWFFPQKSMHAMTQLLGTTSPIYGCAAWKKYPVEERRGGVRIQIVETPTVALSQIAVRRVRDKYTTRQRGRLRKSEISVTDGRKFAVLSLDIFNWEKHCGILLDFLQLELSPWIGFLAESSSVSYC